MKNQLYYFFVLLLVVAGSRADETIFSVYTTYSDSKCTVPIGQFQLNYFITCDPITSCTQYGTSGQYYKLACNQTMSTSFPNGWVAIYSDDRYDDDPFVPCQYPDQVWAGIIDTCFAYPTLLGDINSVIIGECVGDQTPFQIFYYSADCTGDYYHSYTLTFNETCPLVDDLAYIQRYCGSAAEPVSPPMTEPSGPSTPIGTPIDNMIPSDTPMQSPVSAPKDPDTPVGPPSEIPQSEPIADNGPIASVPSSSPQSDTPVIVDSPTTPSSMAPSSAPSTGPVESGRSPTGRLLSGAVQLPNIAACIAFVTIFTLL